MTAVSVPEPAMSGKAIGTTLPLFGLLSGLKKSIPSTISSPMMKITILPATANDCTSRPRKPKNCSPTNKKPIINAPETTVACKLLISPPILILSDANIGIDPRISITANKVSEMVTISFKVILLNCTLERVEFFICCKYTELRQAFENQPS